MIAQALDLIGALAIILGAALSMLAGIGVLRLGDLFLRMHAATKAGTLGLLLIALGTALTQDSASVATKALLTLLFMLATAPIAAHLVGRAVYRAMTPEEREACRVAPDDDF